MHPNADLNIVFNLFLKVVTYNILDDQYRLDRLFQMVGMTNVIPDGWNDKGA